MTDRDEIEAGVDLCDAEINAAQNHLRKRLKDNGRLTGCTSYIQRRMAIGYYHAARIMDYLEAVEFVTPADENGERKLR